MEWFTLVIVLAAIVWFVRSLKIVGPDEMAVLVEYGEPKEFRDSGIRFVPFLPGCYLKRYPKKLYNLTFPEVEVLSSEGKYSPEGENRVNYGAQKLRVKAAIYLFFPTGTELIKVCQRKIPTEEKGLIEFFDETVLGAMRSVLGKKTWKEINATKEDVTGVISNAIKTSPVFEESGIPKECVSFVIEGIRLPEELAKKLQYVDEQRLEAEGAPFEAEQEAEETIGAVIRMEAKIRGKSKEEIQKEINDNDELKKEYRSLGQDLVKRRMSIDGKCLVDIRTLDAKGTQLGDVLPLIAAWKLIPMSGVSSSGGKREDEETERGTEKKKRTKSKKETFAESLERVRGL